MRLNVRDYLRSGAGAALAQAQINYEEHLWDAQVDQVRPARQTQTDCTETIEKKFEFKFK